ncbi:cytochrome P450 [Periconia macrospinosa]|uniref:Cytochrome P450 n=1 Tax=Periconia macrospinosa TaxID=97972 RepID=A0A2V1D8D3_9PLEO|nr:cytochrome P450 [Periconia macrospinosa]
MYRWIHISQDGIDRMFAVSLSAAHNADLPKPQAAAFVINHYLRLQVHPGENFDDLLHRRITPSIVRTLEFENFLDHPTILARSKEGVTVSLLELCNELFVHGTTDAFLGKAIWKVNPNFLDAFKRWERTNWKYMFQMPEFMSKDMILARDEIIKSFILYFRLSPEERSDCNYFMKAAEKMVKDVGCNEEDTARIFMLYFWAIVGNIYKVAFWVLAHLVYDPTLLDSIRTEVTPAMRNGELDELYLAEQCPKLESLISEILRLTVASALVREVVAPTELGGKVLQPGNRILVSYRQLHLNRAVWGQDPLQMEPYRFEENAKLQNSISYRPFGGGNTLCPGRFVAKRSIAYAIALMVLRYNMEIDLERTKSGGIKTHKDLPPFPRLDTTKPSPGVGLPHVDDDIFLSLKKRI